MGSDPGSEGATSNASAHLPYPRTSATFICRNIDSHDSGSQNRPTAEGVQPILSSGSTRAPDTSVSLNSAPEDSSAGQASIGVGAAPSSTHDASWASAPQQTIERGTSLNYTVNPKAGEGSPVMLMHMEIFSGDSWFRNSDTDQHVSHLLPLMLVENGFGVWIGHQRATYLGHGHAQLQPADRAYWNCTWDQHVQYDLPAQLRFISADTNRHVHFIGASQAATVGVAAATDKETAKMITLIGPTAFRGNSNSFLLNAWAYFFGVTLDTTYYTTGFHYTPELSQSGPISGQGLTGMTIGLISGPNCCLGSPSVQMTNGWDGTTSFLKNLLHWQQGIRTNSFQQFVYGTTASNLKAYGQPTPLAYVQCSRHSKPTADTCHRRGGRDWYSPPKGTNNLISQREFNQLRSFRPVF